MVRGRRQCAPPVLGGDSEGPFPDEGEAERDAGGHKRVLPWPLSQQSAGCCSRRTGCTQLAQHHALGEIMTGAFVRAVPDKTREGITCAEEACWNRTHGDGLRPDGGNPCARGIETGALQTVVERGAWSTCRRHPFGASHGAGPRDLRGTQGAQKALRLFGGGVTVCGADVAPESCRYGRRLIVDQLTERTRSWR